MLRGSWASRSCSTRLEPMKPAEPVMRRVWGVFAMFCLSTILPFPAEITIDGEYARTGLSYPGKRPKGRGSRTHAYT